MAAFVAALALDDTFCLEVGQLFFNGLFRNADSLCKSLCCNVLVLSDKKQYLVSCLKVPGFSPQS